MSRWQHLFFLCFICGCVAFAIVTRRPAASAQAEQSGDAAVVPIEPPGDHAVVVDVSAQSRIQVLSEMEAEQRKRKRAGAQTYQVRSSLGAARQEAWTSVISTNWAAYQTLRQKAEKSSTRGTPCTLCDGKGYMRFCILCRDQNGKCAICGGTGRTSFGEYCAGCGGNGKCYLCFGGGKMGCPFCLDGEVVLKLPPPPRVIPLGCEPPANPVFDRDDSEKAASKSAGVVLQGGDEGPSIREIVQREQELQAANAPPSFWQRQHEFILLGTTFLLLGILTKCLLARHKSEAEIRTLSGRYLSDGIDAARFKMPEIFEISHAEQIRTTQLAADENGNETEASQAERRKTLVAEFLSSAPDQLAHMRKTLQELGRGDLQSGLASLHHRVLELKEKAALWEFRPVWQVTSALDLLIHRLTQKSKDATPSTLHTIATAIDLLQQLCVPGIRPNLIIDPPIKVLGVDDEALCRRALGFAFAKADVNADLADSGESAVLLAASKMYDVIFLDIIMPGMDGLAACEKIRETEANSETPIVFVTSRADFQTRAESVVRGGNELMAKPFFVFELTLKMIVFAAQKRLALKQSANLQAREADSSPIPKIYPSSTISNSSPSAVVPVVRALPEKDVPAENDLTREARGDLFARMRHYLAATRQLLNEASAPCDPAERQSLLGTIHERVHTLVEKARVSDLPFITRASAALESLLKRLHQNANTVSASALNTAASAFDMLDRLCRAGIEEKLAKDSPIKIMVVEDEDLARRAVTGALQLTFDKPDSAADGAKALQYASEKAYDVIFSDIEMPHLSGFEFCTRIRAGGPNQNTPVIFITNHTDFEARTRATQSGSSDFIAKPFLPIEITVKALTFAFEGRLQKLNGPIEPQRPRDRMDSASPEAVSSAETA